MRRHRQATESRGEQALAPGSCSLEKGARSSLQLHGWVINAEIKRSSGARRGLRKEPLGAGGWGWMDRSRSPAKQRDARGPSANHQGR